MIQIVLEASTAHISQDDATKIELSRGRGVPLISKYDEGMFFYRPEDKDEMTEEMNDAGYTCVMIDFFTHVFFVMDVDILRLDGGARQLKGFPVFDW